MMSNLRRTDVAILFLDPPGGRQNVFSEHSTSTRQQLNILLTVDVLSVEEDDLDGLICSWGGLVFGDQFVLIIPTRRFIWSGDQARRVARRIGIN